MNATCLYIVMFNVCFRKSYIYIILCNDVIRIIYEYITSMIEVKKNIDDLLYVTNILLR